MTLAAIYDVPPRAGVVFSDIEGLLRGLGAALVAAQAEGVSLNQWAAEVLRAAARA